MKAITTVLTKVIVGQFYRQNAGFLAVVFLIAGSFLRAIEHITLAQIAVHSGFILAIYIAIWAIYALHATRYAVRMIREHDILYLLRILPLRTRFTSLYLTQLQLLLPVLVYAGFVLAISFREYTTLSTWAIVGSLILLSMMPLIWIQYVLRNPNPEQLATNLSASISQRFTTPYGLFFIRQLIHKQPILLLLTKGGTLLLILGVTLLYPTDEYDIRLFGLGVLFASIGHIALVYQLYQFEHERLSLYRNLPISTTQRLLRYVLQLSIIFLPEGILLIRNAPADVSAWGLISVWLLGTSLLLLQFVFLLRRHRPLDKMLLAIFWFIISGFFLIMYRLPLWGLAISILFVSSWLFVRHYWTSVWEVE